MAQTLSFTIVGLRTTGLASTLVAKCMAGDAASDPLTSAFAEVSVAGTPSSDYQWQGSVADDFMGSLVFYDPAEPTNYVLADVSPVASVAGSLAEFIVMMTGMIEQHDNYNRFKTHALETASGGGNEIKTTNTVIFT